MHTISSNTTDSNAPRWAIHLIRLLAPPLPPRPHIPATRAAAAQTCLDEPGEDCERGRRPHEAEEVVSYLGADIDFGDAGDDVSEDDEHDGCDDGGGSAEEGVDEGEEGDGEGPPAGEEGDGDEEHEDEGEAGRGEEEAEHGAGDEADEVEDVVDVRGEVDCTAYPLVKAPERGERTGKEDVLEAPASSSLCRISTGLNQYNAWGGLQYVTPSPR